MSPRPPTRPSYAGWWRRPVVVPALLTLLALSGCGSNDTPAAPSTTSDPTPGRSTPTDGATAATPDRTACRAQLATGDAIARRSVLRQLSLSDFQLRSNDLQEVVEEATHVCSPAVVKPLKASMLRLLSTDDYLLRCSPDRTCSTSQLDARLSQVESLERRAAVRFAREGG